MKIRRDEMIPAIVLIMFTVIIGFLVYTGEDILGITTNDVNTLISLSPGVIVFFVGIYAVSRTGGGPMLFAAVAGVGLAFIYIIYALNEASILIPDLEMTVTDLQILILFIFLLVGAGLAVVKRR